MGIKLICNYYTLWFCKSNPTTAIFDRFAVRSIFQNNLSGKKNTNNPLFQNCYPQFKENIGLTNRRINNYLLIFKEGSI